MVKSKWLPAYINGKPSIPFQSRESGVYLIREKTSKIITYIGMSKSCLYKALYRHFHIWNQPYRVTYVDDRDAYEIRKITLEQEWVDYVEFRLVRFFSPKHNKDLFEGVDAETYWPGNNLDSIEKDFEVVDDLPF